jgi:hypothetical protein
MPLVLLVVLMTLAACSPPQADLQAHSAWGQIYTITQAEQSSAPAIHVDASRVMAAWVGADDSGIHHDARVLLAGDLSPVVVLPLPPANPYAQGLLPAGDDALHLLWLDSDTNQQPYLYSALISASVRVERGPIRLSDRPARRYQALAMGDGGLLVLWSGGLLAEPGLFAQVLDSLGRPQPPALLTADADWPTLARTEDGTLHVLWLRPSDDSLHHARLDGLQLREHQPLPFGLERATGDRLHGLYAALDASHLYLLWNITRADGTPETWHSVRTGDDWSPSARLGVEIHDDSFETGFNTSAATAAGPGTAWLSWAVPLSGQHYILPIAAQVHDHLSIIYFEDGAVRAIQPIAPARLIGAPALQSDRDRFLYLAWSQPTADGTADLNITSMRFR